MKLNFKRLMAMFLSIMMVVGMLPTMVFAEDAVETQSESSSVADVAQIGEQKFESLQAALENAKTQNVIEINLLADATLNITAWQNLAIGGDTTKTITINGDNHTLTFNHLNSDWNNVATKNGAKLILKNMMITNSGHNDGPWNRHDINFACDVELNNVSSDKALAFKAGAVLDTVTISDANTSDTYAIWIQPNGQTVTITNSTIDMMACSDGRGIKIDNQYNKGEEQKVTLDVSGTSFETEEKAAIMVKSAVGADITLSNVDIRGVAADTVNAVWNDEDSADYRNLITVTGGTIAQEGAVAPALSGSGTEADPYVINNIDDLVKFRDDVNAGNTYEEKYVKLTTDIDFEGYTEANSSGDLKPTFRPIGDSSCDASFNGTFDGGNNTISNLYQSGWDLGYEWGSYGSLGLFGVINGATIKNLSVSGFELVVEGGDVAAITGSAEGNCTFKNINVESCICGTYNNGCGGIVGWAADTDYLFENITIDEDTVLAGLWGSFDSSIGGIMGQFDGKNGTATFENVDIACRLDCYNDVTASYKWYSYRMCGMLIGRMTNLQSGTTEVDPRDHVILDNVNITIGEWANYTYIWDDSLSKACQRVEPGYQYGGVNVENYPDAKITMQSFNTIIGGPQSSQRQGYYGSDITKLEALDGFDTSTLFVEDLALLARSSVAKIGDNHFESLQKAIDAAQDGDIITVIADINLSDTELQILDGSYDTYFLVEGKSVTIDLNGKTISGAYTGTNTMLVGVFSTDKGGHLTITGNGTVDVTATNKVYSLITAYEDGCSITVENGTYKLDKASDNLIYYGGYTDAAVKVEGGTFELGNVGEGENGKPWIVNVLGAGDHHVLITGGTFNADINRQHWSNEAVVAETCYTVDNGNVTWTVKDGAVAYVNTGMTTGPYYAPKNIGYATLAEAIAAAVEANDSPVVVIKDCTMDSMVNIPAGKTLTIDLNGKTVTGTDNTSKNFSMIDNRGTLTITDSSTEKTGKMTLIATVNSGWNRYSAVIANNPGGKLIVESGTIEHLGGTDMAYGIDNLTNGKGTYAETIINGGTIKSTYRGIRQFLNGVEAQNILIVNGGVIGGAKKSIWMQDPNKNANRGTITVGENAKLIGDVYLYVTADSTEWPVSVSIANAAFNGESTVVTANIPEQYVVANTDGTWGVIDNPAYGKVAMIGETYFATLAEAITAAQHGDIIVLLDNVTESVTVDKSLTIDGNNKNYTGNISVSGKTTAVVVKNVNFVGYTENYAIITNTIKSITVENCTLDGYDGFLYANRSTPTILVKNVTMYGGIYGIHWVYGTSATLENVKMTNVENGLLIQNHAPKTIALKNCNITSINVWEKATGVQTFKFEGANTVATLSASQYAKYVLAAADATLTAPEGSTVTTSVANSKVKYDNGTYKVVKTVAKIGDQYYETLADALAAAANDATVELIYAEGDAPIAMNGYVSGKTVTITGTAQVNWEKDFLFVGRTANGTATDATLIFKDATLTTTQGGDHGIHVSGAEKGSANKANGTVQIINSTINLSYLINKGNMSLDNSTLTVKSGFSIGGRPANETVSGKDATATISLAKDSKVVVDNHNGMGLGYEAIGVMNIDATSAFETTQSFLVTAKGTMNIAGTATVAGTLTNNGSIVLTNAAATLTSSECDNVTTTVDGYEVKYADDKYAVKKVETPVLTGSIRIVSATLNLLDKVCIIYKATDDTVATNDTDAERGILLFDSADKAESKDIDQAYETVILEWNENEKKFIGQTEGIDARDMNKSQFAVAYVKMTDGTYIFGTKGGDEQILKYSPLIYCKNMKDNDVVGDLCAAMMQYGAAAQVLQYGNTTGLMNEDFADIEYNAAVLDEEVYRANGDLVNGMKLMSVTMDLQGAISYIVKYTSDVSLEEKKLYAEYTLLGKTSSVELEEGNDGRLWAVINGVAPKDLGATLTVKPYYLNENGQKVYGGELVYSGYEYVRRKLNDSNSSNELKELCKALAMYIYYADAYGNE